MWSTFFQPIRLRVQFGLKARANERNMLGKTCCVHLYTMLGYVAWCWHMLRPVWNQSNFLPNICQHFFCSRDRWTRWLHSHMKRMYSVNKSIVCNVLVDVPVLIAHVLVMCLGVFSRWQRAIAIAMHFRVFHRLYSSSAMHNGGQTWQHCSFAKNLGQISIPDSPRYYRKSNIAQHVVIVWTPLKPTSANTIPAMLGNAVPTCCVRLHGLLICTS